MSAKLNGTIDNVVPEICPQAEYNGLTLEYGTLPGLQVLNGMRGDHWLHRNPQTPAAQQERIKSKFRDAFYVDADDWKQQILDQAREVLDQTLNGLATPLQSRS